MDGHIMCFWAILYILRKLKSVGRALFVNSDPSLMFHKIHHFCQNIISSTFTCSDTRDERYIKDKLRMDMDVLRKRVGDGDV